MVEVKPMRDFDATKPERITNAKSTTAPNKYNKAFSWFDMKTN